MSLRQIYKQRRPDGHFFDKGTMDFFGSKLMSGYEEMEDGTIYFMTSELNFQGDQRFWNVRRMEPDGNIETVGEFCAMTQYGAKKAMYKAIENHKSQEA